MATLRHMCLNSKALARHRCAVGLTGALLTACGLSSGAAVDLPRDVTRFFERRETCDHLLGEEPYDEQRRRYLERQARKFCSGSDAELAALKVKYADDPRIAEQLKGYDTDIER